VTPTSTPTATPTTLTPTPFPEASNIAALTSLGEPPESVPWTRVQSIIVFVATVFVTFGFASILGMRKKILGRRKSSKVLSPESDDTDSIEVAVLALEKETRYPDPKASNLSKSWSLNSYQSSNKPTDEIELEDDAQRRNTNVSNSPSSINDKTTADTSLNPKTLLTSALSSGCLLSHCRSCPNYSSDDLSVKAITLEILQEEVEDVASARKDTVAIKKKSSVEYKKPSKLMALEWHQMRRISSNPVALLKARSHENRRKSFCQS